jgi:hypothetical protein
MNHKVIHEFRVTEGRPAGLLEGEPLMLAHFMGAKSGVERVAPLVPLLEKGQSLPAREVLILSGANISAAQSVSSRWSHSYEREATKTWPNEAAQKRAGASHL